MALSRLKLILTAAAVAGSSLVPMGVVAARDVQRGDQRAMGGDGLTIFAEPGFRGLNSNFRSDVPDLRKFNMNDRVDSLQISRGQVWEVCENINYKGRCQVFSGDEPDLARVSWGGMISSFRRLRDDDRRGGGREFPPPPPMRPRLILFDDIGFRGRSFIVDDTVPALRALGNRARSAKVYGGAWELCDGDRFRGHCATVTEGLADLGRIGLRDRVSSARPVGRER